jgi:hypothetical protein
MPFQFPVEFVVLLCFGVFAPRFLLTSPCGSALALRYHFTSIRL